MNARLHPVLRWAPHIILAVLFVGVIASFVWGGKVGGETPGELAINVLLMAVPVVVVFLSLGILATAVEQERLDGRMSQAVKSMLRWTPRVFGLLFALFFSMFALDVFGENYSLWESLLAFAIHALPAIVVLVALAIAWQRPLVGAVLFGGVALWLLAQFGLWWWPEWSLYLVFVGPPLAVGLLYLVGWRYRNELQAGRRPAS